MTTRSQGDLLLHWKQGPNRCDPPTGGATSWPAYHPGFTAGDEVATTQGTPVYTQPSTSASILVTTTTGRALYVTERSMMIDGVTLIPVKYVASNNAGWVNAAHCSLTTVGAAPTYIRPPKVAIPLIEEGLAKASFSLRQLPDATSSALGTFSANTPVSCVDGIASGDWRWGTVGLRSGWINGTEFWWYGESVADFPIFSHRYAWYLDVCEEFTYREGQYMVQEGMFDRRNWQRAGLRMDQVSTLAAATGVVKIVANIIDTATGALRPAATNGRVECYAAPCKDIYQIRASNLPRNAGRNIAHEGGHFFVSAWDVYSANPDGTAVAEDLLGVDPDTFFSVMGNVRDIAGNRNLYPDLDDIASAKDYFLPGTVPTSRIPRTNTRACVQ